LGEIALPTFQRASNERETFKMRVRLHSAETPALAQPGLLTQERPRIEVVVGKARKETEFGDFQGTGGTQATNKSAAGCTGEGGAISSHAPWRFEETLTFSTSITDVLSSGLQVWLQAQSDVRLGPVQVSLSQKRSIGMCSVDLRSRVLPKFEQKGAADGTEPSSLDSCNWQTPVLCLPLTYVGGGNSEHALGENVGSLRVSFGIDIDPAVIQGVMDASTKSLLTRVTDPVKANVDAVKSWMGSADPARWVAEASSAAGCDMVKERIRQIDVEATAAACDMVKKRAQGELRSAQQPEVPDGSEDPAPARFSKGSASTAARSPSGSSSSSSSLSPRRRSTVIAGAAPPAAKQQQRTLVAPPVYIYKTSIEKPGAIPGSASFGSSDSTRMLACSRPTSGKGVSYGSRPIQITSESQAVKVL
jgi:hypothetical protein